MLEDWVYGLKNVYRLSPKWIRRSVGGVYGRLPIAVRLGRTYLKARAFLEESQWWTPEELREWQRLELARLLQHAYRNVPYYKRIFDERKLKPQDIRGPEDMCLLPILTRDLVRQNLDSLIATNMPSMRRLRFTTGGSTGTPLALYWERGRTRSLERAFMWRQWSWAGYHPDRRERTVVLRGHVTRNRLGDYDPIENALILSSYHMRNNALDDYVRRIRAFEPTSIQAYPSVISILAAHMLRVSIRPIDSLRVVICASENLLPQQRMLIESAFGCRVFDFYGQGEQVALAGNCECSNLYHVFSEYGVAELVDQSGELIAEPDGKGQVVATGFNNYLMPLIRYATGDVAIRRPGTCQCGRSYPLWERIEGRVQEYVLAKDGRAVSLTGLIFGLHFDAFGRMRQIQLVQRKRGAVTVRISKTASYTDQDEQEIEEKIKDAMKEDLDISFEYVDEIKRTEAGKHRFLIQELPIAQHWDSFR